MRGSWKLKDGTPAKSYIAEGEATTPDGVVHPYKYVFRAKDCMDVMRKADAALEDEYGGFEERSGRIYRWIATSEEKGELMERAIKDSVDNLYGEPTIED